MKGRRDVWGLVIRRALAASLILVRGSGVAQQSAQIPSDATTHATSRYPGPRLLLNSNGIVALKLRIASSPGAKAAWADLQARAQKGLDQTITLPPRGGNWSHNYVCPIHGARLTQGKEIGPWQWEHTCPVGHHALRADATKAALDFDGNGIAAVHAANAQQVINAGLVFQITGDARYARHARELLLAYANRYLDYPLHDNQGVPGRGGRVASQSLTEAGWLIDMVQGADLVWSTFSDPDRQQIAEKLLRPALDQVILPHRLGIHNIQCRHNSAIGLVGFLLNDQRLISTAIDDPEAGFRAQLEKGVLADGMWAEGSSGYHFFTIAGLWPLAEAARNCGVDLYTPKLQAMFDGPLALAMPNLCLPDFNDSAVVPLQSEADLYELAFARFANPSYVPLLSSSNRRGRLAMLYGVPELPPAGALPDRVSHNSPASGYAVLQRGKGAEATWLCVKYGPHGGGHGHPDKNSFILYARGRILTTDAGTHAYGSPLHLDWDKTTLAHNTLVADQSSQEAATGKSLAFGFTHGVDYSMTDAGAIHKDVSFIRTAAMLTPQIILFVDQVQAGTTHTYDLACHQVGQWEKDARFAYCVGWTPPRAPAYSRLTQTLTSQLSSGTLTLGTRISDDLRPAISLAGNEPTEVITGYGILKTTEDLVPILIQRRRGASTAFAWAISTDGSPVELRLSTVADAAGASLPSAEAALVQVRAGSDAWSILVNPKSKPVTVLLSGGPPRLNSAPFAVLDR